MLKVTLAGLVFAAVAAHAHEKETIRAPSHGEEAHFPDGVSPPSDLTLDPHFFDGGGTGAIWPPAPPNLTEIEGGLRIFPYKSCSDGPIFVCTLAGYYVAGRRRYVDHQWQGIVTRRRADGSEDSDFAPMTSRWASTGPLAVVNDAVVLNDKMYFAGAALVDGKLAFAVACVDLVTYDECSGFNWSQSGWTAVFDNQGVDGDAIAERILADDSYGLLIAGEAKTANGREMAVVRASTVGLPIASFNGSGLLTGLPLSAPVPAADVGVYDMALAPAASPGGARLYIAGMSKRTTTDYDGFVRAMRPDSGASIAQWGGVEPWIAIYPDLGLGMDAVTAIAVQRDGKPVMAGWSQSDVANGRRMILARRNVDGGEDTGFCEGAGTCLRNDPAAGIPDDDWPVAIAERAGNRDLVIALQHASPDAANPHPQHAVWQFGSSGNMKHASVTMEFPRTGGMAGASQPLGMWIGNSGFAGIGAEVVAVVGMREFSPFDYDITISQLIATDSIYADGFGGASAN